jgi:hypothetical protein
MDRAGGSRHVAMQITGHKTESMYRRYNIVTESEHPGCAHEDADLPRHTACHEPVTAMTASIGRGKSV